MYIKPLLCIVVLLWFGRIGALAGQPQTIRLYEGAAPAEQAVLTVYSPEKPNGISILICPGGGYGGLAIKPEGHGIARWLNQHDITGIVLQYRMPRGRHRVPLSDAQLALKTIRTHARHWSINPHQIGIIGFSAGGHLAATVATQADGKKQRPAFAILIYPVITMGQHTHAGSRNNLLGTSPSAELISAYSNERQVTRRTPPTFLAHAVDDKAVPCINSKLFHDACLKHQVASQYLELPDGGHGLNGYQGSSWDTWQEQSLAWLAKRYATP